MKTFFRQVHLRRRNRFHCPTLARFFLEGVFMNNSLQKQVSELKKECASLDGRLSIAIEEADQSKRIFTKDALLKLEEMKSEIKNSREKINSIDERQGKAYYEFCHHQGEFNFTDAIEEELKKEFFKMLFERGESFFTFFRDILIYIKIKRPNDFEAYCSQVEKFFNNLFSYIESDYQQNGREYIENNVKLPEMYVKLKTEDETKRFVSDFMKKKENQNV